jgi:hypothetical protein
MFRTHQMYIQDDWRVTNRLTLNLGVRFEIYQPPLVAHDQASDFSPTTPNPGAGGLPGALVFAGTGQGRIGSHTLVDGWKGVGPRFGFAYSLNSKTAIRGAATRSFGPITYVGNSSHNLGIVQRITVSDQSQGLNPLWALQDGAPAWSQVPNINPSVGNGSNVPYYNGKVAVRPSDDLTYAFNIERQLTATSAIEVGYLGMLAAGIQSALLAYNQLDYNHLPGNLNPFTSSGRTLLNSLVGSSAANAAGVTAPWSGFNDLWRKGATVAQSLRPYPMYSSVDTVNGQGDRIGHSTYHSMQVKFSKRYSSGLTVQASYVLSKLLTDADSGGGTPLDHFNRRLEKSIASYDQTHVVKLNYVYELPFGSGRRFLTSGPAAAILGGWRLSGIQGYSSGTPVNLGTTVGFPIFNGGNRPTVATYDGWRGSYTGGFDPARDSFFQPVSFFGTQPTDRLGTITRYNPRARYFPGYSESFSLAKSIRIHGESKHLDLRFETFNLLNRTQFGALSGGTTLQNANFGLWRTQSNSARRMQVSAKLYW